MDVTLTLTKPNSKIKSIILYLGALAFIYAVPSLSHLLNLPLYLFEPMRILLILTILHTRKSNAFVLALTLPIFSFAVSGHPIFYKMLIMTVELTLNVWLFYRFSRDVRINSLVMLLSIVLSKVVFYILQYLFITASLLTWEQVEHPIIPQLVVVFALTGYVFLVEKLKNAQKSEAGKNQ